MGALITGLFGGIGAAFKSFFDWKDAQAKTVQKAFEVLKAIDNNDATATAALADALQQILTQGSFLERNWRSWLMVSLMIIVGFNFFGMVPPHFNDPLSPMMAQCFDLLKIGLGGYIARRGIVDIVRIFNIGSVLKTLINKQVS